MYNTALQGTQLKFLQVFTLKENTAYIITFSAPIHAHTECYCMLIPPCFWERLFIYCQLWSTTALDPSRSLREGEPQVSPLSLTSTLTFHTLSAFPAHGLSKNYREAVLSSLSLLKKTNLSSLSLLLPRLLVTLTSPSINNINHLDGVKWRDVEMEGSDKRKI